MRIVDQHRNPVYQLYRKDQLMRLKKKIEQIKNRRPIFTKTSSITLPKIPYNRSLSPQKINQILVQNKRLNNKIIKNMLTQRRSGLEVLTQSDVSRVYKSSFPNIKLKTSRVQTKQTNKNDQKQNFNKIISQRQQKQKQRKNKQKIVKNNKKEQKSQNIKKNNKTDQSIRKTLHQQNQNVGAQRA